VSTTSLPAAATPESFGKQSAASASCSTRGFDLPEPKSHVDILASFGLQPVVDKPRKLNRQIVSVSSDDEDDMPAHSEPKFVQFVNNADMVVVRQLQDRSVDKLKPQSPNPEPQPTQAKLEP
jgi:hypothetical protein